MKVAVVERGLVGGTCVNTGCTPTKTMVASAYAAHLARRASDFGVVLDGPVRMDMKQVKARKDVISGASRRSVEQWLRNMPNCTFYEGSARFRSPQEVSVGMESRLQAVTGHNRGKLLESQAVLTAPKIFLRVGARPRPPAMPGLNQVADSLSSSGGEGRGEEVDYLTNSSIMDLDFIPPHLLIVGGSYVGLEFGQMFRRFGS